MKFEMGQRVTLHGQVVAMSDCIDPAGPGRLRCVDERVIVAVDGPIIGRSLVELPSEYVEPAKETKKIEPDELYAAALRCGMLEQEEVPGPWLGKTLRRLKKLEEDWGK